MEVLFRAYVDQEFQYNFPGARSLDMKMDGLYASMCRSGDEGDYFYGVEERAPCCGGELEDHSEPVRLCINCGTPQRPVLGSRDRGDFSLERCWRDVYGEQFVQVWGPLEAELLVHQMVELTGKILSEDGHWRGAPQEWTVSIPWLTSR